MHFFISENHYILWLKVFYCPRTLINASIEKVIYEYPVNNKHFFTGPRCLSRKERQTKRCQKKMTVKPSLKLLQDLLNRKTGNRLTLVKVSYCNRISPLSRDDGDGTTSQTLIPGISKRCCTIGELNRQLFYAIIRDFSFEGMTTVFVFTGLGATQHKNQA